MQKKALNELVASGGKEDNGRKFVKLTEKNQYSLPPKMSLACYYYAQCPFGSFTNDSSSRNQKQKYERQCGSSISRGELWVMLHKKKDGSYIHDNAQVIGEKIIDIEREDDSSKGFSQNDSLSQAIEGAVKYMLQMQGSNLPRELVALVNVMAPNEGNRPISLGVKLSSSASHDVQHNNGHSNHS